MQMLQTCVSLKAHVLGFLFSLPAQPQSSLSKGNLIALPRKLNRLQPRDAPSENENCSAVACGARASRPGKGGGLPREAPWEARRAPQASPDPPPSPAGVPWGLRSGCPVSPLSSQHVRARLGTCFGLGCCPADAPPDGPVRELAPGPGLPSRCVFPSLSAPPVMALLARFGMCVCSSCRTLGSMQRGALSQCFRSQGLPGPPSTSGTRMRGNRSPLGG